MSGQNGLVLYKGQQYAVAALSQELKRYNPMDKYDAQVEIRNYLLACRTRLEETIEQFYHYVIEDRTWVLCGRVGLDVEWKEVKRIAENSRRQRIRLEHARRVIVQDWGELARELVDDEAYTTFSRIRTVSLHWSLAEARPLINAAILARIRRTDRRNREWTISPQLKDYDDVAKKMANPRCDWRTCKSTA